MKKKTKPKGYRTLTAPSATWWCKIGSWSCVLINASTNVKHVVALTAITGMTGADIERGRWKKWFAVHPKEIVDYAEKNL
jgi:hypothetical protein